jgi:glycosyltransferase involved in cell wall biosynthesis
MTNGVRAVFVCSSLGIGGAERLMSVLAPALVDHGFEVQVVTIRARGPFFDDLVARGVDVRFSRVASRFDLRGVSRVVRELPTADVLVTQGLDAQLVGAVAAARRRLTHVTIHHKQPEIVPSFHRRLLARLAAGWTDLVIAVTEAQIPDLVRSGTSRDRVVVVPNGVPDPAVSRARGELRAELGLAEDDVVALLGATLRPEKRATVFVDAIKRAHARDNRIKGVVAGGGVGLQEVRDRAHGSAAVRVLGPRTDLPDVLAAADVLCLTSEAEALPMVILEALALAKPIVATAVGGVPAVVRDGETGRLIEVDDGRSLTAALLELAGDPDELRRLGDGARRLYEASYSADAMVDRYALILRDIAARGR